MISSFTSVIPATVLFKEGRYVDSCTVMFNSLRNGNFGLLHVICLIMSILQQ